ncbi:MAG TPA: NADH-ubiquinone oxidoreductase-F iron-sulfur binding region domain-containing protein [Acidimicrobiales bacterium]|nr:NADH-ubiquinone oxidoreductase-F iron-sulfur binding region domain-containing protein [Acidimicrobiales bacterium]
MTMVQTRPGTPGPLPGGSPRLTRTDGGPGLDGHLARWGPLRLPADLVAEAGRAGLRGRGGAGFPTADKLAAVLAAVRTTGKRPVVVANGTEGEPLSAKDRTLLQHNPHLVLDGMAAAAVVVGADRAVLCVTDPAAAETLRRALSERTGAGRTGVGPVEMAVAVAPDRYVVGEESALVNWLDTGRPLPTRTPPRPSTRGVGRRPTLVDNVETLAQLALLARFGADWWRQAGTADDPGTMLATVNRWVVEIEPGTPLDGLLPAGPVLVGGYSGTWLSADRVPGTTWTRASLGRHGAAFGCGVLATLPDGCCPLAEVARVARWLAAQSAGQCGPCAAGLPAVAAALRGVVAGDPGAVRQVQRWSAMVAGRGACKLPDGAARFVASAMAAFADHVDRHRRHGPCPGVDHPAVLPTPGGAA